MTDVLPPGLTPVSFLLRRGTFAAQVWDVGTLESGASATLTLQARVDSPLAQTNTATVTAVDQFDPDTANDSARCLPRRFAAGRPRRSRRAVSSATPNVGDTITFTVDR